MTFSDDVKARLLADAARAPGGVLDLRALSSDADELLAAEALVDAGMLCVLSARRYGPTVKVNVATKADALKPGKSIRPAIFIGAGASLVALWFFFT